jgi:hypothetical protein
LGPASRVNSKRYRNIASNLLRFRLDNTNRCTDQQSDGCEPSPQISVAPMHSHTFPQHA